MREAFDSQGAAERPLCMVVDGLYTNSTVLRELPENTTLIGRIRGDAKLYHLPEAQPDKGRHRVYGTQAPTPKALLLCEQTPFETVKAMWGGEEQVLRVKKLAPLRWRPAGEAHQLQLVCIAPTRYRLSKNSTLLYRQPA